MEFETQMCSFETLCIYEVWRNRSNVSYSRDIMHEKVNDIGQILYKWKLWM